MRRQSRREFIGMAGAALAGAVVASCTPQSTPKATEVPTAAAQASPVPTQGATGKVVYLFHSPQEQQFHEQWVPKFEETHPGLTVEIQTLEWDDYETKLRTTFAAGTPPDIFWLWVNHTLEFVSNGVLFSMDDLITRDQFPIQDFAQANVEMFMVEGKHYGIPRESSTLVLFWSKKAFADAQLDPPDETWDFDKFLDAAKTLTVANDDPSKRRYGFNALLGGSSTYLMYPFVWGFGGDMLDADITHPTLTDPATIQGYQWLSDLINVHKVSPAPGALKGLNAERLMVEGQLAMEINGRWKVQPMREAAKATGVEASFDVAVVPKGPAGRFTRTSGGAYSIPKDAKNIAGAWEFVKFLAGPEYTEAYTEAGYLFPAYKPVANSDIFLEPGKEPEHSKVFVDSLAFARPERVFAKYAQLTDIVYSALDPVWAGQQTAKDALTAAQPKAEEIFK